MKKLKIILESKYLYLILIIILIIRCFYYINIMNHKSIYDIDETNFKGIVTSIKYYDKYISFDIKGKEKIRCIYYINNKNDINIFKTKYFYGDKVKLIGKLETPSNNTNINQFNYKKYLYYKDIYYILEISNIKKINNNENLLYFIKNSINRRIGSFTNKTSDYLKAFIVGNNKQIDKNIREDYQNIGISHLFAVSGMHISIFSLIVVFLLNKFKINEIIKFIIIGIILFLYLFILEYTSSALRAGILFLLLSIKRLLKINISIKYVFLLTIFIILFINPFILYDIGFIFSVVVSLYLIVFKDYINKNKSYLVRLFKVSFISFLASFPIVIYTYFSINLLSIIYNIILVPFITLIIFPLSLITFFLPFIENIYLFFIGILEFLIKLFCSFNTTITLNKPSIILVIIYYLIISLVLYMISNNNKKYILLFIILVSFHYNYNNIFKSSYLLMLDVSQGDSFILHTNNKIIMIDTGGYKEKEVVNVLKSLGIRNINYLIITHGDYDHIGNSTSLVNSFKVDNVVFNTGNYNKLELELIKLLDKRKIKYYQDLKKLSINNIKLYFLNTDIYDNENNNSNVIYFKLSGYKFLFMGDAGILREKDILEKYNLNDIDFLKVGHHGSNTSSSKYFIDSIKPNNCLISVGKDNRYGHPKDSVLDILDNYCNIFRTDINGSVEIKLKGKNYKIETISPQRR